MDIFTGPVPAPDFSNQIHDFNPGIAPSGLFWTVAVPRGSVEKHPGSGEARWALENFAIRDFFNVVNSLFGPGDNIAARVSFEMNWLGGGDRVAVRSVANDFTGKLVTGPATIEWSASNSAGFTFESAPASTSESHFAYVGKERNGAFF